MNNEMNMIEEMIERNDELNLEELAYDEGGDACGEPDTMSVIRKILRKVAPVFAIVGTTIVLYKCRGCVTKWAVRMLEKKGFTVIQPKSNVDLLEEESSDDQIEHEIDAE